MTSRDVEVRWARLDSLTGLRFFAALLVVLHHLTRHYAPVPGLPDMFEMGSVGVTFFFVLSGFVLTWSSAPAEGRRWFYWKRFARVYPLHALTWLAAVPLVLTQQESAWNPTVALASLLLVQAWIPDPGFYFGMNGPSWSLSCEAFFYAICPFAAPLIGHWSLRRMRLLAVPAAASFVLLTLAAHLLLPRGRSIDFLYTGPAYRLSEFLIGIALATAVRRGWRPRLSVRGSVALAVASYVAATALNMLIKSGAGPFVRLPLSGLPSDLASLMVLPAFTVLIAGAAWADLDGIPNVLTKRRTVQLGEWSFALYLSHLLVITWLARWVPDDLPIITTIVVLVGTLALIVALSGALFTWFERPVERWLRKRMVPAGSWTGP